jgi:ribosomal protein S18 acetylase RimI-like enzyme
MFVALLGGTAVGFAATVRVNGDAVELAALAVLPAHGRRGVGGRLVAAALDSARAAGAARMTVRTELTNDPALRFYDRHGFVPLRTAVQLIGASRVPVVLLTRDT